MALGGFLGGLSNLGQIYGYQQQSDEREMLLRQQRAQQEAQQRAMAAGRAAGSVYGQPDPGMPPPGGPMALGGGGQGGAPAMPPGAPSMPTQPPGQPGAGAPPGGGGMPPPGAGGAPAAPQGQGGYVPQPPPQQQRPGPMTVSELARQIRAKNPGIDDLTLFEALKQSAPLLNQEGQMDLRRAQAEFRMEQLSSNLTLAYDKLRETGAHNQQMEGARMALIQAQSERAQLSAQVRMMGQDKAYDAKLKQLDAQMERLSKTLDQRQERDAGVQQRSDARIAWDKDKTAAKEGRYAEVQNTRIAGSAIQQRIKQLNKEVDEFYKNFSTPNAEQRTKIGTIKGEIAKLQTQYDGLRVKDKTLPGWTDIMKGKSVEEPPEPPAGDAAPARNQLLDWAKDAIKRGAPRDDVVKKLGEMGVSDTSGL